MANIVSKHQIYIRLPDKAPSKEENDPNVVGFNFQKLSDSAVIELIKTFTKNYIDDEKLQNNLITMPPKEAGDWCKEQLTKQIKSTCIQILQPLNPISYENHSGVSLIDLHKKIPKYCIFVPKSLHNGFKKIEIEDKNKMRLLTAGEYLSLFYPKIMEGLIWDAQLEKYTPIIFQDNINKIVDSLDIKDEKLKIYQELLQNKQDAEFLNKINLMTPSDVHSMFSNFYGALKQGA